MDSTLSTRKKSLKPAGEVHFEARGHTGLLKAPGYVGRHGHRSVSGVVWGSEDCHVRYVSVRWAYDPPTYLGAQERL